MRLHNISNPATTIVTLFTILTLNYALLVNGTPQPSRNSLLQVRHPNPHPNYHPEEHPFSPDQPKPTHPAELQHAKEPITISTITITASPTGTPASSAPSFLHPGLFTSALLNSTNFYRAQHNASSVVYNDTLSTFAYHYLDKLGISPFSSSSLPNSKSSSNGKCELVHSQGPYGENLALGCSDVQSCVEMWGNERAKYDFGAAKFGEDTGHFTQLVWKNTTDIGCAARWCQGWNGGGGGWYLVCEYWPGGNVVGEFGEMVNRKVNGGGRLTVGGGWMGMGCLVGVIGAWLVYG